MGTLSIKYIPILIIIMFNNFLNILITKKKKKMVFLNKNSEKKIYRVLTTIVGLSSYNSRYICKKFGFQKECTFKDLDNSDFEQLRNYLTNNFFLEKLLKEQISKHVQKKLDKFRFHYASELFTHAFFKNQRKSKNSKKISKNKKNKKKKKLKSKNSKKLIEIKW